jgi:hypothetical protein
LFPQVSDGGASAAFDAIAAASSFHTNGLAKIPVDSFKILTTDGKYCWPHERIYFLFLSRENYVMSNFRIYIVCLMFLQQLKHQG